MAGGVPTLQLALPAAYYVAAAPAAAVHLAFPAHWPPRSERDS
jgi:hypothetical protein